MAVVPALQNLFAFFSVGTNRASLSYHIITVSYHRDNFTDIYGKQVLKHSAHHLEAKIKIFIIDCSFPVLVGWTLRLGAVIVSVEIP